MYDRELAREILKQIYQSTQTILKRFKPIQSPDDFTDSETKNSFGVDKGLVAMFLKMSPEERLRTNDNAARTILELRNAYQQQKISKRRPKRAT